MCESNEAFLTALISSKKKSCNDGDCGQEIDEPVEVVYTKEEPMEYDLEDGVEENNCHDTNKDVINEDEDEDDIREDDGTKERGDSGKQNKFDKLLDWLVVPNPSITCQLCGDEFTQLDRFDKHVRQHSSNLVLLFIKTIMQSINLSILDSRN